MMMSIDLGRIRSPPSVPLNGRGLGLGKLYMFLWEEVSVVEVLAEQHEVNPYEIGGKDGL